MQGNKVWVVETMHHDPKIGWVPMAAFTERSHAWHRMRESRTDWEAEKFRTVAYAPSGGAEQ